MAQETDLYCHDELLPARVWCEVQILLSGPEYDLHNKNAEPDVVYLRRSPEMHSKVHPGAEIYIKHKDTFGNAYGEMKYLQRGGMRLYRFSDRCSYIKYLPKSRYGPIWTVCTIMIRV